MHIFPYPLPNCPGGSRTLRSAAQNFAANPVSWQRLQQLSHKLRRRVSLLSFILRGWRRHLQARAANLAGTCRGLTGAHCQQKPSVTQHGACRRSQAAAASQLDVHQMSQTARTEGTLDRRPREQKSQDSIRLHICNPIVMIWSYAARKNTWSTACEAVAVHPQFLVTLYGVEHSCP